MPFTPPMPRSRGSRNFPREERPPVLPTFLSFRLMVGLGTFMVLASLLGFVLSRWGKLEDRTLFLKIMLLAIPVPYIATRTRLGSGRGRPPAMDRLRYYEDFRCGLAIDQRCPGHRFAGRFHPALRRARGDRYLSAGESSRKKGLNYNLLYQ